MRLSDSSEPKCCGDECGWYKVLVTPLKLIRNEDRKGYMFQHDYDMKDVSGIIVFVPTDDRLMMYSDVEFCNFDKDFKRIPVDSDCYLAKVELEEVIQNGAHAMYEKPSE